MSNKNRCKAHLYLRTTNKNGSYIFKCTRCPHYAGQKFILGQMALCNSCGNEFTMNKDSLQVKPHCGCRKTVTIQKHVIAGETIIKKRKDERIAEEAKNDLLDELVRRL